MNEVNEIPVPPDFTEDSFGNPIHFEQNSNLKKVKCQLPLTKEHVEEYLRCKNDIYYFLERYYYILDLDSGMTKIKLRDYQKELLNTFIENRFTIAMCPRQVGKSTSFEGFVCHYILFNSFKNVALLANKAMNAVDLLRKIKNAYEMLPKWLQHGVKRWNQNSIELENGCRVFAAASSNSSIRSKAINLLIIDEMAHIPVNTWDAFYASTYPTISSSKESKIIFVSTPNGLNHFYKFWIDSVKQKNAFKHFRVDWWQVPGRDEDWKEQTIANIGQRKFNQEYGNEFLGSAQTLIESAMLPKLVFEDPIENTQTHFIIEEKYRPSLAVWEEPVPNRVYSMSLDAAKMTEENSGDSMCIQITDISAIPFKQVARLYIEKDMSYLQMPQILFDIGNHYNKAYCFIENNEVGQEIANILAFDLEYENVYFEKNGLPGYRTTKRTKRVGCANFKTLIENGTLIIRDYKTISEISTFVKRRDSWAAEKKSRDDSVMSMIGTLFFMQVQGFDDVPDKEDFIRQIFNQEIAVKEQIEELVPFGMMGHVDIDDENDYSWMIDR